MINKKILMNLKNRLNFSLKLMFKISYRISKTSLIIYKYNFENNILR